MSTVNDGYQGWTILEGIYLDDNSLTGMIMPNVPFISPQAIVPNGTTITFNLYTAPAPSGGINGDIWYNKLDNACYKNIAGVWTALNDTVYNSYYLPPVQNLTSCPL